MVLAPESETVIRYSRGQIVMLRVLSVLIFLIAAGVGLLAAMLLAGVFGESGVDHSLKIPVIVCVVGMVGAGVGILIIAGRYSQIYVKIGPEGVRLCQLRQRGLMWKLLPERSFAWDEISEIGCNEYQNYSSFNAGGVSFTLNKWDSPSPAQVAELMAKRKGVRLGRLPNRSSYRV
ncbi:MAG: hypothetical protein ABSF28_10920 [Terracidiphilus sp.]|jgi:hypothetical protein